MKGSMKWCVGELGLFGKWKREGEGAGKVEGMRNEENDEGWKVKDEKGKKRMMLREALLLLFFFFRDRVRELQSEMSEPGDSVWFHFWIF